MGGFFLVGPNYIFRTNLGEDDEEVMCPPFCKVINECLENKLLNKSEKILDINDFPLNLRLKFQSSGGDNEGLYYKIIKREDFVGDISDILDEY